VLNIKSHCESDLTSQFCAKEGFGNTTVFGCKIPKSTSANEKIRSAKAFAAVQATTTVKSIRAGGEALKNPGFHDTNIALFFYNDVQRWG
jgi:hypothetical protein